MISKDLQKYSIDIVVLSEVRLIENGCIDGLYLLLEQENFN